jgi:hypothetical protein
MGSKKEKDAHANVTYDSVCLVRLEDLPQDLPRVHGGVALEKVIQAAIAGDLELGPDAEGCAALLRDANAPEDALQIAVEVERPLVKGARRERYKVPHTGENRYWRTELASRWPEEGRRWPQSKGRTRP